MGFDPITANWAVNEARANAEIGSGVCLPVVDLTGTVVGEGTSDDTLFVSAENKALMDSYTTPFIIIVKFASGMTGQYVLTPVAGGDVHVASGFGITDTVTPVLVSVYTDEDSGICCVFFIPLKDVLTQE